MSVLKNGYEYMTSNYGNRTYWYNGKKVSDFHLGIDLISSKYGTDYIVAFEKGTVTYAGYNGSYGNVVYISHGNGYQTRYAHQKSLSVKVGQSVSKGQVIGYMGTTGNSTGNHLHFEIRKDGSTINPYDYVFNGKVLDISEDYTGVITYQSCTNGWLAEVNKCDNTDNGYAGIGNQLITAYKCKPQFGELIYEGHELGGKWLGSVSSKNYSSGGYDSYAGIIGKPMDLIKIKSTKGYVLYRVKTREDGWLAWVDSRTNSGTESYAGIQGHAIIGIQMK